MHRHEIFLFLVFGLLLVFESNSHAQTITVTPYTPVVALGNTIQFTAQVTGLSGANVTWAAGGVVGGNSTYGTITPEGLYTAPAIAPTQEVEITATSTVNSAIAGFAFVSVLAAGPIISSVSPNPVAVGNLTVTIQGTGFQPGAEIVDTYGNLAVQLTTLAVTPTSVTASGYQGNAATASFTVRNPGSSPSNAITVPIAGAAPPSMYTLNVIDGTGGGSYTAGTVITITANAPPNGQSFVNWTGATVANANATTTTFTMPAANSTVTANYTSPSAPVPYPVSSHPRLWVTINDLPRLQSWASATNPIYAQGMVPLLQQALNIYNTQFFPNGAPNPNYPDPGDVQGYSGYLTEQYGAILAFNSLIDPNPAARIQYAQYARNLLMVAMNQAALGHLANAPFRDPLFAIYNHASGSGEQWPLIVDWIYNTRDGQGNPILTSSDKQTIRNVFMMWANDCLNAETTGGDHPSPVGVMNDPQLLPNNQPYRMASNNYYLAHARLLTMMALSIDPADDPPLNASSPPSQLGNTLRSYINDATGAWLYQEFAMMGDPTTVGQAYNMPANGAGFGLASGGLPPEGYLYGESFAYVLGQLLALQTAGFNNPTYSGPQIGLIGAPVWDRYVTGYLSSLTPTAQVFASESYLGPLYQFAGYGDMLREYATPDMMGSFALLALLEQENGRNTNANAARWFAVNAVEGGSAALLSRITDPWSWGSTHAILYYLLLDPTVTTITDPRPAFPPLFYDPPAGRILAHTDWSAQGTLFDYRASWISINHQVGDGGQFELFRKGEWLTKEMSNYDNNAVGLTTVYHNTLALQNWCADGTPNLNFFENGMWANGSQWMEGENAGDPTTLYSAGPGYVYATSDLTNLYNRPDFWSPNLAATDIVQATRSILWLNADYIVVYDRATSVHPGLFKRFNLSLVTNPVLSGNTATETLASGQQLFVQTLLPAAPSMTIMNGANNLNPIAELEPTSYILTVEDASHPTDTRFLHVLQGADAGAPMTPAVYLQSTAGVAFDGAVFGSTAVYFPVSATGTFSGATYTVPTGIHTLLVTGLTANTAFGVSVQSGGSGSVIVVTPGGSSATTDDAGVLHVAF